MKIFLNDRLICLYREKPSRNDYHSVSTKQEVSLLYHAFEADPEQKKLGLFSADYEKLKEDFQQLFHLVLAAGGVVKNEKNEILFIYRRGHWDFPKGKLNIINNVLEGRQKAAIREVMEETGIERIDIVGKAGKTHHIFFEKGERYLKTTFWFEMRAPKNQPLTPQTEEDITEVRWFLPDELDKVRGLLYPSLMKLIDL
ncbi:MAG TPA: NUDIX domain-containing protein [Bacteroidales bacterium]|nr:NUDIX domain-containing protein [Bacteroidales bacterium]HPS74637.1 NUDIX domain-containing protein [Bacteroidales bacterium]